MRRSVLALIAGFLLLAVLAAANFMLAGAQSRAMAEMAETVETRGRLYQFLSSLQDAETGQRGYLLTGQQSYLGPYSDAVTLIDDELPGLRDIIAGDAAQMRNLAELEAVTAEKLAELGETVQAFNAGRPGEAMVIVESDRGRIAMDRARALVAEMVAHENALLGAVQAETANAARLLTAGAAMASLLLVALGIFAVLNARSQLIGLAASRDALSESNMNLMQEALRRERLEEQLRQSQKMEAVGQLTGGLAHDFNNMLAVIIGSLNMVERRMARGETGLDRFIQSAREAAERAASLTHRLLAFARQQPLAPEAIDVNKLTGSLSDLLRRTLGEAVRLETVLAGGLWRAHVDAGQLENAILNLAVNARDAMAEGGRLTIETANAHLDDAYVESNADVASGQYVMIAVTDSGRGMTPDVVAKAFEPFFTTKEAGRGTGLGLSQVYGFIKQSRGHVKIYSEPGHGTTVKMYLPRFTGEAPKEAAPAARTDERQLPLGRADEIILVVEDEDSVRTLTVENLRELGYTVVHADGAAEALRVLDSHPDITLLFTDIVMPDINGRKLADEAVRRKPELKVLFTTGYTRNAIIHNGVLDHGVQLISKPFTLEQLATKVRDVLEE